MSAVWTRPVRAYMSRELLSVRPETPLADVQALFEARDISAVPVLDDGALVGIVTSTDLLREARIEMATRESMSRVTPPPRSAAELMRRDVLTVDEDAPISTAAERMTKHRVHRLVVLRSRTPVAVVSTRDAARAVLEQRVATPLANLMTTTLVTIEVGESVEVAIRMLDDANVHGLVVVDGGWPVGVFTHNEAIRARGLVPELRQMPVERVMSYETICLDVETPLYRVAGYAIQMRTRRILAVHKRDLVGIVTGLDLLRVMRA